MQNWAFGETLSNNKGNTVNTANTVEQQNKWNKKFHILIDKKLFANIDLSRSTFGK